jgi:hypothetical protein
MADEAAIRSGLAAAAATTILAITTAASGASGYLVESTAQQVEESAHCFSPLFLLVCGCPNPMTQQPL